MKKIINILSVTTCLLLFFCSSKDKINDASYTLAFVKDVYIDANDSTYTKGDGERTESFVGIFSKKQDTIIIYKLNQDLNEKPEKFSFWSKNKNNQSITFYCSMRDNIKITFSNQNNIIVNNDIYQVNKEYYSFLKQKILVEKSILDLTYFLKDGYGDYAESLEPLNKNWRNQKENNKFKIIKVKIKNRNYQSDDLFFSCNFIYKYNKDGILKSISGENRFNKNFVEENNKYIVYRIDRSINDRAFDNEYLYKNKKTLFDSIVGNREMNSNATTYYYTKYQSKLEIKEVAVKPKNLKEIIVMMKLNKLHPMKQQ